MTWLLTPGSSWNGSTNYSARTPPVQTNTVHGSGFSERAVAAFDEADGMWVEELGHVITVGAGIGDRAMIASVTFWLEGNTQTVTEMTVNPRTGSIGFCTTVASRPGQNGDAQLYAIVKPVNGLERVIGPLNLTLNTDRTNGTRIDRLVRYVNFDTGSDAATGETQCTAWRTMKQAFISAPSGAIVHLEGTTKADVQSAGFPKGRMIEFRGKGVGLTFLRPVSAFRFNLTKVMFSNLTIETDLISQLYGNNVNTARIVCKNCIIGHTVSASGNLDKGYPVGTRNNSKLNLFFRNQEGQKWYLIDSEVKDLFSTGVQLWRNCVASVSGDLIQHGSYVSGGGNDAAVFGLDATQHGNAEQRLHNDIDIVVQSVAAGAGNQKVITFAGSPGIAGTGYLRVLQSANNLPAGDNRFPRNEDATQDYQWLGYKIRASTANTITVEDLDNALGALVAGDLCRAYSIAHGDVYQTVQQANGAPTFENFYVQNLKARGHTWQPILLQSCFQTNTTGTGTGGAKVLFASPALSSSGDVASFAGNHGIQRWSWLRLESGPQSGEARVVAEIISPTQVRLASPFSADQTGTTWSARRAIKDVFICNSVLYLSDSIDQIGQVEPGLIHVTLANCVVPGISPNGTSLVFVAMQTGADLFRNVRFFDSIFKNLNASFQVGVAPMPVSGCFDGDNNWYCTGINRDLGGPADGNFWTVLGEAFADAYRAPAAMTRTHTGKQVMLPYDLNRAARSASAKVGAVAQ